MEEALIKRVLPHSVEAEQSVIGSMIMDQDAIMTASEVITSEDFYQSQYGVLFDAMLELYNEGKPVDLVTLQERLREKDVPPEISSLEFVKDLLDAVPTSANVRHYATIVQEKSMLRKLIKVNEEIANTCYLAKERTEDILEETEKKIEVIKAEFDMPDPVSDPVTRKLTREDLYQSAKTAVALDKLVEKYNLTGLAYYYEGAEASLRRQVAQSFIVGNSILNAQGIPMCGEFDIKTLIAMLIMDRLDIGGSFAEFHPFDFKEDFILVGHDGPHHLRVAEGKPVLRSLTKFHGKPGSGASVEFKLKEGPITMLGITQTASGGFKFVIGEGESEKGPIPPTGNTNTRGFFKPTTKEFVKKWVMEGPTHHYALGIGHRAKTIEKIAGILGIESVTVK